MSYRLSALFMLMLVCFSTTRSMAQPAPLPPGTQPAAETSPEGQTPEQAAALGPANAKFIEQHLRFTKLLKELTEWKHEYQQAGAKRQKELESLYPARRAEAEKLRQDCVISAMAAFDEAPNKNHYACELLYSLVKWEFFRDNYEVSYDVFKKISATGLEPQARALYLFGGLAAMMTMHLDDAEAWLKIAKEGGFYRDYMQYMASSSKADQDTARGFDQMVSMIPEYRKSWSEEEAIRKREAEAGAADPEKRLPRVLLKTTQGDIVLELFENEAPNTVANFISLVEKGFYKNVPFHRVLPAFMAQGGDGEKGNGSGGPGYFIPCECLQPGYRKHFRGSLSMAKMPAPNTGGSQFFLTFIPTTFLDGQHTVFGRVVEGMPILADLQRINPENKDAIVPQIDKIIEAKILNKRNHPYVPKTLPER